MAQLDNETNAPLLMGTDVWRHVAIYLGGRDTLHFQLTCSDLHESCDEYLWQQMCERDHGLALKTPIMSGVTWQGLYRRSTRRGLSEMVQVLDPDTPDPNDPANAPANPPPYPTTHELDSEGPERDWGTSNAASVYFLPLYRQAERDSVRMESVAVMQAVTGFCFPFARELCEGPLCLSMYGKGIRLLPTPRGEGEEEMELLDQMKGASTPIAPLWFPGFSIDQPGADGELSLMDARHLLSLVTATATTIVFITSNGAAEEAHRWLEGVLPPVESAMVDPLTHDAIAPSLLFLSVQTHEEGEGALRLESTDPFALPRSVVEKTRDSQGGSLDLEDSGLAQWLCNACSKCCSAIIHLPTFVPYYGDRRLGTLEGPGEDCYYPEPSTYPLFSREAQGVRAELSSTLRSLLPGTPLCRPLIGSGSIPQRLCDIHCFLMRASVNWHKVKDGSGRLEGLWLLDLPVAFQDDRDESLRFYATEMRNRLHMHSNASDVVPEMLPTPVTQEGNPCRFSDYIPDWYPMELQDILELNDECFHAALKHFSLLTVARGLVGRSAAGLNNDCKGRLNDEFREIWRRNGSFSRRQTRTAHRECFGSFMQEMQGRIVTKDAYTPEAQSSRSAPSNWRSGALKGLVVSLKGSGRPPSPPSAGSDAGGPGPSGEPQADSEASVWYIEHFMARYSDTLANTAGQRKSDVATSASEELLDVWWQKFQDHNATCAALSAAERGDVEGEGHSPADYGLSTPKGFLSMSSMAKAHDKIGKQLAARAQQGLKESDRIRNSMQATGARASQEAARQSDGLRLRASLEVAAFSEPDCEAWATRRVAKAQALGIEMDDDMGFRRQEKTRKWRGDLAAFSSPSLLRTGLSKLLR